ncbi:MAG TPA: CCA tRNA nucleotidyltransferase [Candidatus Polarisedimenticolaceae bacterium]|nr:CCA tRNA nucleotidyltransferase [Candidatus Polarisedimenticolaceae bacterium]
MLKRIRDLLSFGTRSRELEDAAPLVTAPPSPEPIAVPAPPVHLGPRVVHQPIPEEDLDPDAVKIVRRLSRFDHTAYLVGGCVRDLLIGRRPKDFDIATTATPRQVRRAFSNCRIIGRRFRLAHVYFQNGKVIEVATFRARDVREPEEFAENGGEGEDGDADLLIRDDNVFGTPEEDALRRDFTINALFYDVNSGNVIDHADGLTDLRRKLVRTIGDPKVRFREDPIRILRAVKFAARLGFTIEAETRAALLATRAEIPKAAPPRILEEINRFCRGGAARASFDLLHDTGVLEILLPELAPAYAEHRERLPELHALLDAMDARIAAGGEVETGWILAALLFPALAERLGFHADGRVQGRRGLQVREMVEPFLRPLSLRLRVSRRDQEHARQILLALQRMVPARQVRRSLVHALVRRPAFADALATLRCLGAHLGGEVAETAAFWAEAAAGREPAAPPQASPGGADAGAAEPRRRRRRGGRGRGRGGETGGAETSAEAAPPVRRERVRPPRTEARPGMPPPWDDNYFFAALPTVPDLGDADPGDRYGATTVAAPAEEAPAEGTAAQADAPENAGNRRRRRRRPRRRRPAGDPGHTTE